MGEGRSARAYPCLRRVWRRVFISTLLCRPRSEVSARGGVVFPCAARLPAPNRPRRRLCMALSTVPPPAPPKSTSAGTATDTRESDRVSAAAAAGAPRRGVALRARLVGLLPPLVFGAFVLALWLLARRQLIEARGLAAARLLLPAPTEVLRS